MKKLVRLLVVLALLAAAGFGWFHQSVHYALLELGRGVREADVQVVERHLDIDAFAKVAAEFYKEVGKVEAKKALGGGLLGDLAAGVADVFGDAVAGEVQPEMAAKLRRAIVQGEVQAFGPFVPVDGFKAIGDVIDRSGGRKSVILVGHCYDEVTSVNVTFERVNGLFGVPMLGTWRAVGVEHDSLAILAGTCRDAYKNVQKVKG